ncbi:MAG: EamA family transporter [Thermodesulfobacteriota bacterium]
MALRGYFFVLLAAVCWGITGPFAKLAFSQGVQPLEVAFWRCALGFAPFTLQALLHPDRAGLRLAPRDRGPMLAFALLCVAGFYGVYQLAIAAGGAALACVLMYTAPAFVALMAWLVLGESMTPAKLAAVAATLAGVAAVSGLLSPGAALAAGPAALAFGLLSGFTYALYYIFGKRFLSRYRTPVIFMYALPVGGLVLWPLVEFTPKTPSAWLAILVCSLVATYAAYSFYYAGLRHLEATRAAVAATLEPVVAAALAFAWWGESFSGPAWLGSGLILGAVGLTLWDGRRSSAAALRRARGAELAP